jgi:hypothetical protein
MLLLLSFKQLSGTALISLFQMDVLLCVIGMCLLVIDACASLLQQQFSVAYVPCSGVCVLYNTNSPFRFRRAKLIGHLKT